jgi:hypothetical protein
MERYWKRHSSSWKQAGADSSVLGFLRAQPVALSFYDHNQLICQKDTMKTAVLASLIATAAAFAPAQKAVTSTALSASNFEDALGAQPPVSNR